MASRTSSATYAASSDATLNFSQISVTETDTDTNAVPNFSKVAGFLPGAGGKATAPVTGAIAAAPTYDGLTWASFNAGVYAGCSMSLTFSYTVSAVDPTMGISALQQLFTTDYLSVPAGVSIVATETASSNGQQVGQFSVALDAGGQSSQPSSYALPTAYQSLQISVTYTMAASTVSAATGVDVSRIIQGFQTAPVTTGSIGDFVWNDLNGNGIYDTNESAMSGVTVDLLDANGGSFGVTTTDTTGHYLFSSLNAGTYQVQFVAPTLYSFTTQVAGSGTQTVSAANVATGRTGLITLSAGQNILVEDAGLVIGLSGSGGGMIPLISIDEQIVVNSQTFEAGNGVLTPYPTVLAGSTLTEQDIVTNTGTVALSNVVVTDSQGRRITVGSLAAGASYTIAPSETVTAVNNVLSTDTATATGTYTDNLGRTTTVSATDSVDYLGVSASVALDKQISTDGTNWVDAGTGNLTQNPGVLVGATLYERVIVTNTGAVALSHLTVSDVGGNGPASFAVGSTLAIGASETSAVAIVTTASGYQLDTATVTGTGTDNVGQTTTVTASDQANYTGIPLNPDVSILKTVTSVGGVAGNPAVTYAGEVITYNIVVTNTGNVTLTNVVVTDPTLGTTLDTLPSLAPGASKTYIASQVATQTQINNANASVRIYAASGTGADGAENAAATITVKNDQIIIVLSSGQVNPTGAGQEVSGIRFTLGNTPISASLTSASGTLIDIVAGGTVTSHAGVIDHWGVAQSGATLTLATAGAGSVGGKPTDLIIGPGPYTNANPSITGRDPQIQGPATFILSAPGVTLGTTITSVGIEFGTGPDNVLTATQTGSTVGGAITNTAKVTDDQTGAKFSTASTAIAGGYTPAIFTTHVYYDTNADGVQNIGTNSTETNLFGVTVALLDSNGVATGQTAVTNSSGNVSFTGLVPGGYQVAVTTPAGDLITQHTNTLTTNILASGQVANAIEGVYLPATFNTHVYYDTNADGVQNTGTNSTETNLSGVIVALLDSNGVATGQTAVTNSSGNVSFTGLVPGGYQVAVTTPAGDLITQHTNTLTTNVLAPGQVANAIEGLTVPVPPGTATFTTHVYYDTNKDGVQNTGTNSTETNLAGVTVTLLTGTGASTGKTAITNSAGNVSFAGLAPGSYEVAVTTPAGDVVTKAINVGTPNTLVAGGSATAFEGVVASTPGITVDKTASVNAVNAAAGFSTVTYTYKVTNTGNTALNNIKLVDNHGTSLLPDNMSPVSVLATCSQYNVGDANRNGVLDVGESWTYQAKIIETGNYVGNPSISATTSISGCSTQGGETIWLSSVLKSYQTTDGTSYAFKGVTANVHLANGTNQSYSVPDSYVTFSSACTGPTTTWDAVQHAWITTLKAGSSVGNVFMTGVPITVPAGTNMNGATVSMTVNTAVSSNGATAPSWAISTSAYDNFKTSTGDDASHDYSKIGVKSSDNGATNYTGNSSYDKAGTPGETEDNHGGSNYSANYGWHYSSDDYGRGTYTWGRSGYSSNFGGSTNTGSTGYSATTTMHMTALSDSTVIDNVTVSAQTICPTGYGGGSYSGSGGDDGYRGGYYGNGSSGDDGRYRNGSYGAGERDDGGDYNNGTGSYGGSSSYSNYNTSSYGSWGDHSYSYGSYYTWGDYGSCSSYSSSYNYGSSYYGSSSSSDGKITWDSARSVWTDDKSSSTGYYGSGIDDREVTSGGDKVGLEDDYSKSCGTNGGTTTTPSGCVVTTVTGSDMQNVQVLATTNIQLGGIATTAELKTAYGAATKLEFTYSPSDVVSASNLQNGIATANGHNTDSLAFIEVSNSSNPFATGAKLYFAGTVGTGAKFIADATVDINNNLLPVGTFGNLYTFIFADQNNFNAHAAPIQTIVYDATGGNGGMHINDQIGSIKLAGYVGTTGHGYLAA